MKLQVGLLVVSFLASLIAGLLVMPILKKLGVSQHIRDDGPESHLKKEGTPSMGGIIFLAAMCFVGFMAMIKYPTSRQTLLILVGSTLIFGFIGFIDDYLKIKNKRSLGLYAWQKILLLLRTYMADANELFDLESTDKQIEEWKFQQRKSRSGISGRK